MDTLRTLTYAFFLAKPALNIFPTLGGLFGSQTSSVVDGFNAHGVEYYSNILTLCNLILITGFGIFWFCRMLSFLRALRADAAFSAALDAGYRERLLREPDLLFRYELRSVFLFLCAASVFSLDLAIDRINVLPDLICAVLLLLTVSVLRKWSSLLPYARAAAIAGCALSVIAEVFSDWFGYTCAEYATYHGIGFSTESVLLFLASIFFQLLWQASALYVIRAIYLALCEVVEKRIAAISADASRQEQEETAELCATLRKWLRRAWIFCVIYAGSAVLCVAFASVWSEYWLIHAALGIGLAVSVIRAVGTIHDQFEYSYL